MEYVNEFSAELVIGRLLELFVLVLIGLIKE